MYFPYLKNLNPNPDPKLRWKPDPNPSPDPKEIISDPEHWLEDKKTVVKTAKMIEIKALFKQNTGEYLLTWTELSGGDNQVAHYGLHSSCLVMAVLHGRLDKLLMWN